MLNDDHHNDHDAYADNEVHWHVDCDFVHPSLYHTVFQIHANYVAPLIARIVMIVLVMVSMLTTVAMCHVDNTGRHLHRVGE